MITIISTHPWHGSFSKAIIDTIIAKYEKENKAYQIIDLPKDNFNPVLTEQELAVFNKGEALDPLVHTYQEMISRTDEIIFVFPIWWSTMPAILKGFFDKVLLYNFAYNDNGGWTALLKINKTTIVTTSQSPTEMFRKEIEGVVIPSMLNAVGMNNAKWFNCDNISHGTDEMRKEFLAKIERDL